MRSGYIRSLICFICTHVMYKNEYKSGEVRSGKKNEWSITIYVRLLAFVGFTKNRWQHVANVNGMWMLIIASRTTMAHMAVVGFWVVTGNQAQLYGDVQNSDLRCCDDIKWHRQEMISAESRPTTLQQGINCLLWITDKLPVIRLVPSGYPFFDQEHEMRMHPIY